MSDDPSEFVSEFFPGLVADLQRNDVSKFEEQQKKEREARAALRHQQPGVGLSASELLKKLDGDPEDARRKVEEDLARIDKQAQAAAAQKDQKNEPLPIGHFPPPPTSTSG